MGSDPSHQSFSSTWHVLVRGLTPALPITRDAQFLERLAGSVLASKKAFSTGHKNSLSLTGKRPP